MHIGSRFELYRKLQLPQVPRMGVMIIFITYIRTYVIAASWAGDSSMMANGSLRRPWVKLSFDLLKLMHRTEERYI